jgi:hypothetical protein
MRVLVLDRYHWCLFVWSTPTVKKEAPGPSMGTSSTTMTSSKKKSDLKRGQHGRHQISKKKAFVIHNIGSKEEPLEPTTIIGTFSN